MISESKVILLPLKGISLRVTFPKVYRCGIMATQLLAMLTTDYLLLRCGIVVYLVNPRHPSYSISSDLCFVSQLKRCCYVSSHELILSCSVFSKIDCSRVFPFPFLSWLAGVLRARRQDKMVFKSTFIWSATWIVKIILVCITLHLTLRLNLETRFLFSGGELSHP